MATTPSKTVGTSLLAWQDVASAAQVISSAVDVSTKWAAAFGVRLGRATGSAFTAGWPNLRIEGSAAISGNAEWCPLFSLQMAIGASIGSTTLNGAITAGATSLTLTSATNFAVGNLLFLGHTTTPADYELARIKALSGTTVTLEEACTNAHDNGCVITNQAEVYFPAVDLSTYARVRAVCDNANSGQGIKVEVLMNTFDSF